MTSVTTPERPYRPDIDALRAIAVVSVIAYHFDNGILPKGYLGVDIFFVISGYVITSSLASRHHPSFTAFISSFYAARIKRLVPALVTCIALTCVVGYLFIAPDTALFKSSWKAGVAALVGASNSTF
jgi:peptidoglycan/LPS O-acetylase OafA/YrhL